MLRMACVACSARMLQLPPRSREERADEHSRCLPSYCFPATALERGAARVERAGKPASNASKYRCCLE
eukprot:8676962-Alexandrium_andersonii.AAC.1